MLFTIAFELIVFLHTIPNVCTVFLAPVHRQFDTIIMGVALLTIYVHRYLDCQIEIVSHQNT